MPRSRANTTINIFTIPTLDQYGEIVGSEAIVDTNIPASLIEQRQIVADPQNNNAPSVVRWAVLRVNRTLASELTQDRIVMDTKTGIRWVVDSVTKLDNPTVSMDARIQLRLATDAV